MTPERLAAIRKRYNPSDKYHRDADNEQARSHNSALELVAKHCESAREAEGR